MNKLSAVMLVALLSGCATAPQYTKMNNDELCQGLGYAKASGDVKTEHKILDELKTREGDMNRCQVYFEKGVKQHQGKI